MIQEEMNMHAQLELHIKKKEIYLKDRNSICWLKKGDHNTSYFHKMANVRKMTTGIHSLLINDVLTTYL